MDILEEEKETGQGNLPARSPREVFAYHLRLLFVDAGRPTLESVAQECAAGVTVNRLSAWRQGPAALGRDDASTCEPRYYSDSRGTALP